MRWIEDHFRQLSVAMAAGSVGIWIVGSILAIPLDFWRSVLPMVNPETVGFLNVLFELAIAPLLSLGLAIFSGILVYIGAKRIKAHSIHIGLCVVGLCLSSFLLVSTVFGCIALMTMEF
jgi:hypothetical protein